MSDTQGILELARQNNGMVTTAMVVQAGFSRGSLKYLSDSGNLEKVARGVYILPYLKPGKMNSKIYRTDINVVSIPWIQPCS